MFGGMVMKTVYDLYEARNWFQAHDCDNINCVHHNVRTECHSYPEAEQFFLRWLGDCGKLEPYPLD